MVGSANVDLVHAVERLPAPGETVLARDVSRHPGGKGLNQAVTAARQGAPTRLVAALGDDEGAELLLTTMTTAGVVADRVRRVPGPTGSALITVDAAGENTIVVAAGANETLTGLRQEERRAVEGAAVLVVQLEIPVETVAAAVTVASTAGVTTVLNAAPAAQLPDEVLTAVDVLVVNQVEASTLAAGVPDASAAGRSLLDRCRAVVVTLGADGAVVLVRDQAEQRVPAVPADVVDTTGAGDSFVGALAARLAAGDALATAVEVAVVAGALAVETAGAVPSIPTAEQVRARRER